MSQSALLLVDPRDRELLPEDTPALPGFDTVHIMEVDYSALDAAIPAVRERVARDQIDIVLYSRNDQVFERRDLGAMIRAVPAGYSSFSGIDTQDAHEQAAAAVDDLMAGSTRLNWSRPEPLQRTTTRSGTNGTFSLVFDTEQICGARFGLPRILTLLERYQAPATFFVTGFIHDLYPDLLPTLHTYGHEVGVHGQFHERLAGLPQAKQTGHLRRHLEAFRRHTPVTGANFIYRADAGTIKAFAENAIDYFVVFAEHRYRPFAYRTLYTRPLPVCQDRRILWLVPVPVETYTLPIWALRPLVDSNLARARQDGDTHVTILMHPFRDGNSRHIKGLEKLLHHLTVKHSLRPVTLREKVAAYQAAHQQKPDGVHIHTAIQRVDQSHPEAPSGWWQRSELYFERIARLYQDLSARGYTPALACISGMEPARTRSVTVYPERFPGQATTCHALDPLNASHRHSPEYALLLDAAGNGAEVTIGPTPSGIDRRTMAGLSRPHKPHDLLALAPEAAVRIAHRLKPGRMVF